MKIKLCIFTLCLTLNDSEAKAPIKIEDQNRLKKIYESQKNVGPHIKPLKKSNKKKSKPKTTIAPSSYEEWSPAKIENISAKG